MRIVGWLAVLFAGFLASLIYKFNHFGYVDWDLAFFSQASWRLLHGDQFVPLVGINYFGDHSYFIHLFILPFYALFPSALTLLALKLAAFFVAVFLVYQIAREKLGEKMAAGVALLFVLFPGNFFALFYEFNPEAFAPPFLLLMFRALEKKNFRRMVFWSLFLMLIKENMFIVAAAFGVRALFVVDPKERRQCAVFLAACLVLFGVVVAFVIPHFRGLGQHAFAVRYAWLGNSLGDMLLTPFLHPQELLKRVLFQNYLLHLFSYLLIPALFSPVALLMMLPLLLQHLLSGSMPEHSIFYHYVPALAPFIFMAFIATLEKIKRHSEHSGREVQLVGLFLLAALPVLWSYREMMLVRDWNLMAKDRAAIAQQLLSRIPARAGVLTTFRFLAPLSSRDDLYSFHMLYGDEFNDAAAMARTELNTRKAFVLPERVSYALIDLDDPWYVETLKMGRESELKRLDAFFHDPRWKTVAEEGRVRLLVRSPEK